MESARKCKERNVDRLSALPDGVICHILSFLETQESVQTSVLAKRWRFLWAHVPVLDFFYWKNRTRAKTKSFPGLVCAVLLRHKVQSLNTFELTYMENDDDDDDGGPCSELESCFATVVERNVQNIHLGLKFEVPRCLLNCKTLVDLRMGVHVRIPSSGLISLPSLKKLRYYCFNYWVDLTRLLSGCPLLEDLSLWGYPLSSCNISSPTLKRLSMRYVNGIENQPDYLVNITAPALRYLEVNDCSYRHITVLPPASLVEAQILLRTSFESDDLYPPSVLKYLDSFCNVKCLTILGQDAEFPDLEVAGRPNVRFGNLTKLQLTADWRLLTKFLQSADQLEVLIFSEIHRKSESWTEPMLERCACLLHSLRNVTMYRFDCMEHECNMVSFILRNAQVLKRMEIQCIQQDLKNKFDALQRISLVRRGSRECELVFG